MTAPTARPRNPSATNSGRPATGASPGAAMTAADSVTTSPRSIGPQRTGPQTADRLATLVTAIGALISPPTCSRPSLGVTSGRVPRPRPAKAKTAVTDRAAGAGADAAVAGAGHGTAAARPERPRPLLANPIGPARTAIAPTTNRCRPAMACAQPGRPNRPAASGPTAMLPPLGRPTGTRAADVDAAGVGARAGLLPGAKDRRAARRAGRAARRAGRAVSRGATATPVLHRPCPVAVAVTSPPSPAATTRTTRGSTSSASRT